MQEHNENCCPLGEDAHEVVVNIEFDLEDTADGERVSVKSASIRSHIHQVPHEVAAQSLILIAVRMLVEHLAHDAFAGFENDELAHAMARASATAYAMEMLKNLPNSIEVVASIPDDISELLEEGNN